MSTLFNVAIAIWIQSWKKGLEPPRLAAPDPKSGAATNYATSALGFFVRCKDLL